MDINALVAQAAEMEDQTEVTAGGDFEYTPPAAGKTIARFIEYVELGKHVEIFKGTPKAPADQVRVVFELLHKEKNIREIEVNGVKQQVADRITWTGPKLLNDKAKFFKLFKAMSYGRTEITHMAQMLGEAFILDIKHNTKELEGGKKRTYANLWADGAWGVHAPRVEDPIAGTSTDISKSVPAPISPIRVFLWNIPTKPTWDTLFIDGEKDEKQPDGTIKKVSKNWLQERILSATNFGGSALEQLVAGLDKLPTTGAEKSSEQSKTQTDSKPDESAGAGTQTGATAIDNDPNAALAALGLG